MLAPCSHFNLSVLDERPAALLKTLIKIFARNNHSNTRGEGLNFQTPVLDLSQHFLDGSYFVDNVQVISIVDHLMEGARKLLAWVYKGLEFKIVHFKCFCKTICL